MKAAVTMLIAASLAALTGATLVALMLSAIASGQDVAEERMCQDALEESAQLLEESAQLYEEARAEEVGEIIRDMHASRDFCDGMTEHAQFCERFYEAEAIALIKNADELLPAAEALGYDTHCIRAPGHDLPLPTAGQWAELERRLASLEDAARDAPQREIRPYSGDRADPR